VAIVGKTWAIFSSLWDRLVIVVLQGEGKMCKRRNSMKGIMSLTKDRRGGYLLLQKTMPHRNVELPQDKKRGKPGEQRDEI